MHYVVMSLLVAVLADTTVFPFVPQSNNSAACCFLQEFIAISAQFVYFRHNVVAILSSISVRRGLFDISVISA